MSRGRREAKKQQKGGKKDPFLPLSSLCAFLPLC